MNPEVDAQVSDSVSADTIKITDSLKITTGTDRLTAADSLKTEVKKDSVKHVYQMPFSSKSGIISRSEILRNDYRYTGDLFNRFRFSFNKNFGFIGHPDELFIYGTGAGGTGFIDEGVLFNNRFTGYADMNLIQSEMIDSIEVLPAPRGFLYGPYNNIVSVNFINRDIYSEQPYTRIKYYEGPFGEALAGGTFSSTLFRKFSFSFDATNRKSDDRYINTEYGSWQVKTKLKYFASDALNLTAHYSFVNSKSGFNGGVDVDSIAANNDDINSVIYDNILAPVISPSRSYKVKRHLFGLRSFFNPVEYLTTDLNLYYLFTLDEDIEPLDTAENKYTIKNKTYGLNIKQLINYAIFRLELLGNYEGGELRSISVMPGNFSDKKTDIAVISGAAIFTINLFDSTFIPSVFFKQTHQNFSSTVSGAGENLSGFGADLSFLQSNSLSFYAGYSSFEHFLVKNNVQTIEAGARINYKNLLTTDISIFNRKNFFISNTSFSVSGEENEISGLGVNSVIGLWKLKLETAFSWYINYSGSSHLKDLPEFNLNGGFFFEDVLFDSSLQLKAGFTVTHTGNNYFAINEQQGLIRVQSSDKIDFTATGKIREVAIVYFTWENLLNEKYYLVPYYPMPDRGIRFGLAWELWN
ncbi:MAG: hypothetical protein Kow0098_19090 [Ignavibacteriaceae bacterium]